MCVGQGDASITTPGGPLASQQYYITTAINYTNGNPHMGHAYEVRRSLPFLLLMPSLGSQG